MDNLISVSNLSKTYASGFQALKDVSLDIRRGEILALLGPNGAGKTTLINIICGIVNPTESTVSVDGHDIITDYRQTRSLIGLMPQELTTEVFEKVWATVSFSRGLFGKKPDPGHIEKVLKDLSLWDKKDSMITELSGGMKRRLLIAKALSHEPLNAIPPALDAYNLELAEGGTRLVYTYDTHAERTGITALLGALNDAGIKFRDLQTTQSSLEDIFVNLVKGAA